MPKIKSFKTWDGRRVYDPDNMNDKRAGWAGDCLELMETLTGCSVEAGEALGDLLTDLHHWCDRNHEDLAARFASSANMYRQETSKDGN